MVYVRPTGGLPSNHWPGTARPGIELATFWLQVRRLL